MIFAKHSIFHRFIFNFYIDRKLKSFFNNFYLTCHFTIPSTENSILVLPNHFSWWDGFLVDFLHRIFFPDYKIFMMVLKDTLEKFWFFKYLGTYSINPAKPKEVLESLRYTEKILAQKKNFVVIFPQGNLEPYSVDKVEFKKGLTQLIDKAESFFYVQLLGLKIQFENEMKPNVYCNPYEIRNSHNYKDNLAKLKIDFVDNLKILEEKSLNREAVLKIF